jgi:hypothetical protein
MKIYNYLLFLAFVNFTFAQQITTAKIESVSENGLHKMVIPLAIRSYSKEDMSDFRILDSDAKEVPYSIININFEATHFDYTAFKIISKKTIANQNTEIIVENSVKNLDQLILSISNSKIQKKYSISGSNDQKNWFGLLENQLLTDYAQTVAIPVPKTSFQFIKIDFNDKKSLPINIEKIGFSKIAYQAYPTEKNIPEKLNINQIATEKKTQINVVFPHSQIVNHINFQVSAPTFYKRNARIYVFKNEKIKHKLIQIKELIYEFELNSDNLKSYEIPHLNQKEFFIEIDNQDNPPLQFSSIDFNQNNAIVIADLKTNQHYTIETGNPKRKMPNYDLPHFTDKYLITNQLPEAKIVQINHPKATTKTKKIKQFWEQSWFMWICILIAGITIAFFTKSLIKDMKNS